MIPAEQVELVDDFTSFGVHAFTTTRLVGSFSSASTEPAREVMGRWDALRATVADRGVRRLATAAQVHGAHVRVHVPGWEGWLRGPPADGHVATARGTALAVTIADCVPIFLAHPAGAVAALHSGWRGTSARIVEQGIAALAHRGFPAAELRMHLGPAICGKCYQVSPEVAQQLTGEPASAPRTVDLRALISSQARAMGVHHVSASPSCTRCDNDRFYSHRAGDAGRQVAVIFAA
jgi:purine-nucleoside/S-methyl-5'-thioadenosine phosphorylase / adenosine deaminase